MITIGFSAHYVETLPFAYEEMKRHSVIILEEPPSPLFPAMLQAEVSIDSYLQEFDSAFPMYQRHMCTILRELHNSGKRIVQVEPYLETLRHIEELFATGKTPADVTNMPGMREVYLSEKRATESLLSYYDSAMSGRFESIVQALKIFAKADAWRLRLRAQMRAKAIASTVTLNEPVYVEAGYIHFSLYCDLRNEIADDGEIRIAYLLDPSIRKPSERTEWPVPELGQAGEVPPTPPVCGRVIDAVLVWMEETWMLFDS